jgi:hypothetical protein
MSKPLIRRETAMTNALVSACKNAGIDTSNVRLPRKTEPSWTVTRRPKRR